MKLREANTLYNAMYSMLPAGVAQRFFFFYQVLTLKDPKALHKYSDTFKYNHLWGGMQQLATQELTTI